MAQGGQASLHDVIAVHVENELHHALLHRGDQHVDLLIRIGNLDHLLHNASAVHIERDGDELRGGAANQGDPLLDGAVLHELLNEVIAERVHRKWHDVDADGLKHEVNVRAVAQVKLVLQESTSVLVMGKLQQPPQRRGFLYGTNFSALAQEELLAVAVACIARVVPAHAGVLRRPRPRPRSPFATPPW